MLEERPLYLPALLVTGELLRETGRLEQAEAFYRKALKQDKAQEIAIKGLLEVCLNNGRSKEAL